MRAWLVLLGVLVAGLWACESGNDGGPTGSMPMCQAGATQWCACVGGATGAQACLPGGMSWGECDCGGGPPTPDAGGNGGGPDTSEPPRDTAVAPDEVGGPAPPEGTLSASVISTTLVSTGQQEQTWSYDVGFGLVAFDGAGASIDDLTAADITTNDYYDADGSAEVWQGELVCTPRRVQNTVPAVSVPLVMDQSGSIVDTDPNDLRLWAAKEFLASLTPPDEVVLITFASGNPCSQYTIARWGEFTTDYASLTATIDSFANCEGGDTPLYDACLSAINEVTTSGRNAGKALVVFTDGDDTASSHSEAQVIAQAHGVGVRIFTIGLSNAVNLPVLSNIAQQTDGAFFYAPDIGAMISAFRGMNHLLTGSYTVYDCTRGLQATVPAGYQPGTWHTGVTVTHAEERTQAVLFLSFRDAQPAQ